MGAALDLGRRGDGGGHAADGRRPALPTAPAEEDPAQRSHFGREALSALLRKVPKNPAPPAREPGRRQQQRHRRQLQHRQQQYQQQQQPQ